MTSDTALRRTAILAATILLVATSGVPAHLHLLLAGGAGHSHHAPACRVCHDEREPVDDAKPKHSHDTCPVCQELAACRSAVLELPPALLTPWDLVVFDGPQPTSPPVCRVLLGAVSPRGPPLILA